MQEKDDTGFACERCYEDLATHRVFSDITDIWVCTPCANYAASLPGVGPGRMTVVPLDTPSSPAN